VGHKTGVRRCLTEYAFKYHAVHDGASISSSETEATEISKHHCHQSTALHLLQTLHQLRKARPLHRLSLHTQLGQLSLASLQGHLIEYQLRLG